MSTLIDKKQGVDGVSDPFSINTQITVIALGLEDTDEVSFWLTLYTDPLKDNCACPPYQVQLPAVLDEVQLTCCGEPVVLTRSNPFVVLDAPQGVKLRAKLLDPMGQPPIISTQKVVSYESNTKVNDRLRGCPCEESGGA